jgi:hypothetical protein
MDSRSYYRWPRTIQKIVKSKIVSLLHKPRNGFLVNARGEHMIRKFFQILSQIKRKLNVKDMSASKSNQNLDKTNSFSLAKCRLASNPGTSRDVLNKLAEKPQTEVLERIAENRHTSSETLEKLADKNISEVRSALADNAHTPTQVIETLASDENPDVRYILAENPNTPKEILDKLTVDDNPYVSFRAQRTLRRMGIC